MPRESRLAICICGHRSFHHTYTKPEITGRIYKGNCRRCNCEVFEVKEK